MGIREELLVCMLGVLAVLAAAYGIPRIYGVLRRPEGDGAPLVLVRGIRAFIVSAAFSSIAIGRLTDSEGFFWFGVFFLAEELYETGVMLLILRWGRSRGFV